MCDGTTHLDFIGFLTPDARKWSPGALGVSSAILPEVTVQGAGSIPILSFTAEEIRWVQPR
jgi:hypothetical protein